MPKNYARQAYGKKGYKRFKKVAKIKKMVTGEGPTLLEKIASGVGGVASVAKAVLPAIAAINTEAKYDDEASTNTCYNPGSNDVIVCLTNNIAQGTSDSERIGNSILAKDINVRGYAYWAPTVTTGPFVNVGRYIMFVWKDNANANGPTAAKILETPTNINSHYNKDYTDQFVVLKDQRIPMNAWINASVTQDVHEFKIYKKLNFHIRWLNATTGGTQNHVYMMFMGSNTASANATVFQIYSRLNYTDN